MLLHSQTARFATSKYRLLISRDLLSFTEASSDEHSKRGDGSVAFDDGVGQVSGVWVLGRPPAATPGLLVYVMVDNAAATLEAIVAKGGEIVQQIGADAPEITARFRDPGGNVIGLYQQPS